ncbi:MAG: TIGR00341 family protein [Cyclobacteriaceae bacterium]|nr:TIGR00341 family protein [Cyclobacteriaceae bacterium]
MEKETKRFIISFRRLYKNVLGFEEGTDKEATIEGIKKDISFRGHTAWILIFSIFIASIGLNVNSTAVIIGAMLISPLMGPILGIGLSVGTNDYDTFTRSLRNLGIAIAIALFTSTLYFMLTPLKVEQAELLARTRPTLLDVMIALFGGFAGIIAGSRKEKTNVIPGVAIATALMPPLCTAGYGLANLKMEYFFGAFYLFFINSVFISLSTLLVVRYLKFPLVEFLDTRKLKRYRLMLISFLIITVTPSTIIFYGVIQEARFKVKAEKFVDEKCNFNGSELLSYKTRYNDTLSTIDLYYIGDKIDENRILLMRDQVTSYGFVDNSLYTITKKVALNVHQEKDNNVNLDQRLTDMNNNLRIKLIEDIYTKNEEQIKDKDLKIKLLEDELLKKSKVDTIPFSQLKREFAYNFPIVEKYSYAKATELNVKNDTTRYDTIPVFLLQMNRRYKYSYRQKQLQKAQDWLRVRLNNDKIKTIEY